MQNIRGVKKVRGVFEKEPGSRIWWIRYSDQNGRERREKVGAKSAAIALYQKRKSDARAGVKLPDNLRSRGVRVGELALDALKWYQDRNKKSLRSFEQRINVIVTELGGRAATDMSPQHIDDWLSGHTGWSPATKNRYKSVLSKAYQLALKNGVVERNPARLVDHRPEITRRIRYLLPDEEVRLRAAVIKLSPKQLPALEVALHTGMRQGEQFALTWDRVDFGRRTIYLTDTKNGSPREIPMSRSCYSALKLLHKTPCKDGGVFPSSRFQASITDPKRWWKAALVEAEIENFRWHDLRHTFVSRLVMAGVDLRTVQELSGHRELSMMTRYAHLSPDHNRKAIEKLDTIPA